MYKSVFIERFKRKEYCKIEEWEFETIKKELDYVVDLINKGIRDERDHFSLYMQNCYSRLNGMSGICPIIGIEIKINFVEKNAKK